MKVYNWIVPIRGEFAETIAATLARIGADFQMERIEAGYAVGLTNRNAYELVVNLKHFDPASEVFEGQQYVVVNCSLGSGPLFGDPGELNVMPGEEPHTFGTIMSAAREVNSLMEEYDHDLETAQIFQLIPAPLDWVEESLKLVKEENDGNE